MACSTVPQTTASSRTPLIRVKTHLQRSVFVILPAVTNQRDFSFPLVKTKYKLISPTECNIFTYRNTICLNSQIIHTQTIEAFVPNSLKLRGKTTFNINKLWAFPIKSILFVLHMCSQRTTIISLHSINRRVIAMETIYSLLDSVWILSTKVN
jgi:hypothetical protein